MRERVTEEQKCLGLHSHVSTPSGGHPPDPDPWAHCFRALGCSRLWCTGR